MSKPYPPNQYAPPQSGNTGPTASGGLRYGEMYSHVFENPNWLANVLLAGVCLLIPIVGPIVVLGYRCEVIDHWNKYSQATYPNFDFGRFSLYLSRGIWPFLVLFIGGFLAVPLVIATYAIGFLVFILATSFGPEGALVGTILSFLVLFLGIILSMMLIGLVLVPMELKAGMQSDFAAGFDLTFIKGFIALVWKETLVGFLFLYLANFALGLVGLLMFCVGIYFAIAIGVMAQTHFQHQLYLLYLRRGGTPVPPARTIPGPPTKAPSGW